jgi:hypothetical protein
MMMSCMRDVGALNVVERLVNLDLLTATVLVEHRDYHFERRAPLLRAPELRDQEGGALVQCEALPGPALDRLHVKRASRSRDLVENMWRR